MKKQTCKKYKISIVSAIFAFQLIFPQFTHAYVVANIDISNSILAIANSPQSIMFDAQDLYEPDRLSLADHRSPRKTMMVTITAYSSTVDQTDSTPFITANGEHVRDGIVAANFLPFGATIKLPGLYNDKVFTVEDRMNQRYYYKIDIWMSTREAAKQFGVKYAMVEIY
jgi:3D (Asp-Asp-Asp) domain-containing protein